MKVLLDTHTLIWAVDNPAKLTGKAATILQDPNNDLFVSAATVWETAIKVALKKLTLSQPFHAWMTKAIGDLGASILPIMIAHADAQINLPQHHRDPFDRLLTAQVLVEGMSLLSADPVFDQYAITPYGSGSSDAEMAAIPGGRNARRCGRLVSASGAASAPH